MKLKIEGKLEIGFKRWLQWKTGVRTWVFKDLPQSAQFGLINEFLGLYDEKKELEQLKQKQDEYNMD